MAECYRNTSKPRKLNGRIFASKNLKKYFCLRIWGILTLSVPTYESLNITSIKALFLFQHLTTRFGRYICPCGRIGLYYVILSLSHCEDNAFLSKYQIKHMIFCKQLEINYMFHNIHL